MLSSFVFPRASGDISACVSSYITLVISLNHAYPLMYALFHLDRFLAGCTASASFGLSPHSSGESVTQRVPLFAFKVSSFSSIFKCQRSRATAGACVSSQRNDECQQGSCEGFTSTQAEMCSIS